LKLIRMILDDGHGPHASVPNDETVSPVAQGAAATAGFVVFESAGCASHARPRRGARKALAPRFEAIDPPAGDRTWKHH
jgi:hypothetical protein